MLAETTAAAWRQFSESRWLDTIAAEEANLRAAQDWILDRGHGELGLRLALGLYAYWLTRVPSQDESAWVRQILAMVPPVERGEAAVRRARAIHLVGILRHHAGDYATAQRWYAEALALRYALGDLDGQVVSLHNMALLADSLGDPERACDLFAEPIRLSRERGDGMQLARTLCSYAISAIALDRRSDAKEALDEAEAILRDGGSVRDYARYWLSRGEVAWRTGDAETARRCWEESRVRYQQLGDEHWVAAVLPKLSRVALAAHQNVRAATLIAEALGHGRASEELGLVADLLDVQAAVAAASGQAEGAARLLGAADAVYETMAAVPSPFERAERDRTAAAIEAALGEPAAALARATGRELPLGRAVEEALAVAEVLAETVPARPAADVMLTRRERDVLRLLVEGHTDREIGAALFLSHRTVATHVSNLLAKLGVPSRAAAATAASRRGLVEEPGHARP